MPYCKWKKDEWETLILSIQQNNCILMLGPEAAAEEVDGQSRPLSEILAQQLAKKIDRETKERINTFDLTQVSQYYYMKNGRIELESKVRSFYEERQNLTSNLHKNLASLPFYFAITTTPDNMFQEALKSKGKIPMIGHYNFKGENPEIVKMGTPETPLLFHLYGVTNHSESLLLTENDLLDFLVALILKRPFPVNIKSELQSKSKIFLFLGFGFQHWYLRILLHILQVRNHNSPSFALEQFKHKYTGDLDYVIFFFQKNDYKIHIFKHKLNRFVEELKKRYEENSPPITREGPECQPEVFICHTNEDKEHANLLSENLKRAGVRPWLDKNNLRGGVDWNQHIEKTIRKVNYFIVMQSQALAQKTIGYVNREIYYALERQKDFRGPIFIIPVKIDDCPLLEELKKFKTIDLTEAGKIEELKSAIKRDFARRSK